MEKSQAIQMQMKKFGWREGQGLGKNEQGMKEAIKVSIKNNKNGLGLDPSEQFVFHWWDHVFNKVANSIKIKDVDGEVVVSKCQDVGEMERISSKRPANTFATKNLLYGRFVQSGTTVVGNEIIKTNCESSESESEEEQDRARTDFSNINTLERAFEMSGGRTAHTAARHGNSLGGKLKRLQEQESKECSSNKKMKNCHEKRSKIRENRIEADMEQVVKKSSRAVKKEARRARNSMGEMSSYRKSSSMINKANKQSMSNRTVMMLDNSHPACEESTRAEGFFLSSDTKTQQDCKNKRESSGDCRVTDKCLSVKDDPVKSTEKKVLSKKSRIQKDISEAKRTKKKKKKKKRRRNNDIEEV